MSQTTTLILLGQTPYTGSATNPIYNVTGEKFAAASYYLSCKDIQTVNISTTNFSGNLYIQCSLNENPSSTTIPPDWFNIYTLTANHNAIANSPEQLASNSNIGVNIKGNFVWMRAYIENFSHGIVNWVKLSY
jgi:hypothetical protein